MKQDKLVPDLIDEEEEMDYSSRPFDYRDLDTSAAMICEHDASVRQKIRENLRTLHFNVIEPATSKEALKYTKFQTFNVIVFNENFDLDANGYNNILDYLEGLTMSVRRQIFAVMISSTFATLDYMNSFNKSVNLIINKEDISEIGMILKKEMEENEYFYHVFKEFQTKLGKV